MRPYKELLNRYQSDASFNKMVNLFRQLIEEYGFFPQEIREGLFFAQYTYEMGRVQEVIRDEEDWEKIEMLRNAMKQNFIDATEILK